MYQTELSREKVVGPGIPTPLRHILSNFVPLKNGLYRFRPSYAEGRSLGQELQHRQDIQSDFVSLKNGFYRFRPSYAEGRSLGQEFQHR